MRLEQGLHDAGVEHGTANPDLVDGLHEAVRVTEALLEQVGDAGRAVLEQLQGVLGVVVLREHHDTDPRVAAPDVMGEIDALGGERRWHPDVQQHDVGDVVLEEPEQFRSVAGGPDHLDARVGGDRGPSALPDQVVVLSDHEGEAVVAHGTSPRPPAVAAPSTGY